MALEKQIISFKLLQDALESHGALMEFLHFLLEELANEYIRPTTDFEHQQWQTLECQGVCVIQQGLVSFALAQPKQLSWRGGGPLILCCINYIEMIYGKAVFFWNLIKTRDRMEMKVQFCCKYRGRVHANNIVAFSSDKIIKYTYLIACVLNKWFIIGFKF